MYETIWIIIILGVAVAGWLVGFFYRGIVRSKKDRLAEERAVELVKEAETRQKETILEAKEEAVRIRSEAEAENRQRRSEIGRQEKKLSQKAENLDHKIESCERRERALVQKEKEIEAGLSRVEKLKQEQRERLEIVAGMSSAEARSQLLNAVESETRDNLAQRMRQVETQIKAESDEKARTIIAEALQRCASEVATEATVSVVALPSDEMKGRLIGREGRNIRALEAATGADLIVDDTPESVSLSCFDPVRREIARVALEKLIRDGRIHPGRIEEVVEKAKKEVEADIQTEGERVAFKAGVVGLHPEIISLLGRLKYRFSYGQNMISHSLEVAQLSAALATEIGANVSIARTAGLLHDIGKAVDHDGEGLHALLGANILKRLGVGLEIVGGVAGHHEEADTIDVYGFIVSAADAISGARPGARMESVEHYLKRIEALENIASSFPGVEKSFAIQAGREVRILVKPDEIDDLASLRLARDIARKVEEGLEYPGQIKVTVIRETRSVEYAK
ncbi:MAG: Ribonuclease Y [Chloroflexi bacterium]|nr:Ribonuclease Y [Chloroflexota bacterium]